MIQQQKESLFLDEASLSQSFDKYANQVNRHHISKRRNNLIDHIGRGEMLYILASDPTALGFIVVDFVVYRIDCFLRHDIGMMKYVE